ncbi:MAG: hypothetical protein O2807_02460 [bacterium]|nr:hypothetical protein [bacterium]
MGSSRVVISARNIKKIYTSGSGIPVTAINGLDLDVYENEFLSGTSKNLPYFISDVIQ